MLKIYTSYVKLSGRAPEKQVTMVSSGEGSGAGVRWQTGQQSQPSLE